MRKSNAYHILIYMIFTFLEFVNNKKDQMSKRIVVLLSSK